jgi:hypothetical protein
VFRDLQVCTEMKAVIKILGITVFIIGTTAATGIVFDVPVLTHWRFTYNMAFPTAIAFMLTGFCIAKLERK